MGAWTPMTISLSVTPSRSCGSVTPAPAPAAVDGGLGPAGPAAAVRLPGATPPGVEPVGAPAEDWAGTVDAERPPTTAAAGPERVVGEEPEVMVAVVPVAGVTSAAPVAAGSVVAPAMGAATGSGPPTPAFCPQAAVTSTAVTAARARSRLAVNGRLEGEDDRAVMVVGEQSHRFGDRQPADLIDLRVGGEPVLPAHGLHGPVTHGLRAALAVVIAGRGQLGTETAGVAGLLLPFPQGTVGVAFARVALPLGKGPVVVAGAVHPHDSWEAVLRGPPHHPAGGPDVVAGRRGLLPGHDRRLCEAGVVSGPVPVRRAVAVTVLIAVAWLTGLPAGAAGAAPAGGPPVRRVLVVS